MTIEEYQTITGLTVTDEARVTAEITKTQRMLEVMLGYTLDPELVDDNQYTEIGKTSTTCPCPDVDVDELLAADAVVGAYRLFPYRKGEKIISIDPASEVHKVKLVKDGVTFKTFETDDYRLHTINGITKYIEECENCCWCTCNSECYCTQLTVDADWLELSDDLLQVWADMVTYYSDPKKDIKSETLGTHSYSKFATRPENETFNLAILNKYVGANGSLRRIFTV